MPIEWKDSYRLGEPLIDQQHENLFVLANAMLAARDQSQMRLCAMQLYQHVREHFADEESLMRRVNFPGYKAHVESHNNTLKRLGAISHAIGSNTVDTAVVVEFLNDWGLKHIPHDDAQVARYILQHPLP